MEQLYNTEIFTIASKAFMLGPVVLSGLIIFLMVWIYRLLSKNLFNDFFQRNIVEEVQGKKFKRIILFLLFFIAFLSILYLNDLNFTLLGPEESPLRFSLIIEALLIIQLARFLDWIISNILIHKYYTQRDAVRKTKPEPSHPEARATRVVQYVVYVFALVLILQTFNFDYEFFTISKGKEEIPFKLSNVLNTILVLLIGRLVVWFITQLAMYGYYRSNNVDRGVQFAFNQLISYVIYVVVAIIALQTLGINMTLIWGGAAALLVGIGLGLQQTFNDFFSGIVLLFERSVKIGDVLHVDGTVGKVKKIGLRSSVIETIGKIALTVPNSTLVNENIHNWSQLSNYIRFDVSVGVAYGSDTDLVKNILLEAARNHVHILKSPAPFVRFVDFGDSALVFTIYFFSRSYLLFEDIKSDLRFVIDKAFRENQVTIPFPQRDIWYKNKGN